MLDMLQIYEWEKKGVPFRSHIYVSEVHPLTDCPFHEREDEAYVLKVLWLCKIVIFFYVYAQSLRNGGPQDMNGKGLWIIPL